LLIVSEESEERKMPTLAVKFTLAVSFSVTPPLRRSLWQRFERDQRTGRVDHGGGSSMTIT
jgi:hypothetical protein